MYNVGGSALNFLRQVWISVNHQWQIIWITVPKKMLRLSLFHIYLVCICFSIINIEFVFQFIAQSKWRIGDVTHNKQVTDQLTSRSKYIWLFPCIHKSRNSFSGFMIFTQLLYLHFRAPNTPTLNLPTQQYKRHFTVQSPTLHMIILLC